MKAITTRSGVAYEGPSIPTNPSPKKVVERETEETTDKEQSNFQGSTAQIPPPVIPISILEPIPNIPYPSRLNQEKSRDKASNQMEKIFQIIQDLRFDMSFADALLLMPRFAPTIKSLLMNKRKFLKFATIRIDFKKFTDEPALVCLPPSEDDNDEKENKEVNEISRSAAYAMNFRVICKESIFHSNKTPQVYLVFAITSTLSSIEPKYSLIMGDDHLSTFSDKEIIPIPRESKDASRSDSKNVLPSYDDFSSINVPRDNSVTFFNPLFKFNDEYVSSDISLLFDEVLEDIECKDSHNSNHDEATFLVTTLSDSNKDECLAPGDDVEILLHRDPSIPMKRGDNDEIDAFLAIEISTCIEEGYYDSEGDSDPLHHEFVGELITLSPRIVREHEEYLNHMMLLCGNSSSQSPENFHVNPSSIIESLLTSPIHVEDSDPVQEGIDIFSGLDDSTPPGIESDVESEGDVIVRNNLLNNDISLPGYECLTFDIESDAVVINNSDELNEDECFDPGGRLLLKKTIPSHVSFGLVSRMSPTLWILLFFPPSRVKTPFLTLTSLLRTSGISSGWNFHVL
ncbi:hypothetical protein Tco_0869738 [Tanacetum coccineum]